MAALLALTARALAPSAGFAARRMTLPIAGQFLTSTAGFATGASGSVADGAAGPASDGRHTRIGQLPEQTELRQKMAAVFGRPLTLRELSLFKVDGPAFKPVREKGFQYGLADELLEGRTELVKTAVDIINGSEHQRTRFKVAEAVNKFKLAEFDCGSTPVQIAALTERIMAVNSHLSKHRKDHSARRQLMILVNRRRTLLRYLMFRDYNQYRIVLRETGLRPVPLFNAALPPAALSRPRMAHKEVHAKRIRQGARKSRGHKGH